MTLKVVRLSAKAPEQQLLALKLLRHRLNQLSHRGKKMKRLQPGREGIVAVVYLLLTDTAEMRHGKQKRRQPLSLLRRDGLHAAELVGETVRIPQ